MLDIKIIEKLKKASAKRSPDFLDSLIFHAKVEANKNFISHFTFHANV
jgi:hypothetical protein